MGRPTGLRCPGSLPESDKADQTRLRGLGSLPRRGQTDRARLPRITSRDRRGRPNQAGAWDHFLGAGRPTGLGCQGSPPEIDEADQTRLGPGITSSSWADRPGQDAQDHFPRSTRQTKPGWGLGSLPHCGPTNRAGCPGSLPETGEADQTRLRGLGSLPHRGQTKPGQGPGITSSAWADRPG